jgi:phage tail tape-measure protein
MSGPIAKARMGVGGLATSLARAEHASQSLSARIGALVKGPRSIAALERVSYVAGYAIGSLARGLGGLALRGVGLAATAVTGVLAFLTYGVIKTGATFEVFLAQLESSEGSAAKAKEAFAWVRKFAAETPYNVEQVTEAFVRARKAGIDPYNEGLRAMGDAASGTNKTMLDAVEAIADAQNFQYERLREFNITSSTKGGAVVFDYMTKSGKEASKTVKKTKIDIQHAIKDIFNEMYGGGMKLRSLTLPGIISNLQDVFTNFQYDIANAGFYDKVKSKLQAFLTWTNKITADGTLATWAKKISAALSEMTERAWVFASKIKWGEVATDLKLVGTAIWSIISLLAKAVNLIGKLDTMLRSLPQPPSWVGGGPDGKSGGIKPPAWIGKADESIRKFMTTPLNELFGSAAPRAPAHGAPLPSSPSRNPPANRPAGNAKISLHVTTDRGVSVRATRLAAAGLDVDVNTGRAMAGVA